jgi:hypothetical protein
MNRQPEMTAGVFNWKYGEGSAGISDRTVYLILRTTCYLLLPVRLDVVKYYRFLLSTFSGNERVLKKKAMYE